MTQANARQICCYILGKNRENEFSFGDSEFQVLEGLSFIHLTNPQWWAAHCEDWRPFLLKTGSFRNSLVVQFLPCRCPGPLFGPWPGN